MMSAVPPLPRTPPAFLDHPGPIAMAHRGWSAAWPENSMAAFAAAVDLGYRYLETDVQATSDGVLLAFHDHRLDRVTSSRGRIAHLPYARVSTARIGGTEPIPRLEDVLGSWPTARVNIDVKAAGAIVPLAEALRRTRAQHRVCVTSFSERRRRAALEALAEPDVAWSPGVRGVASVVRAVRRSRAQGRGSAVASTLRALAGAPCLQVPAALGPLTVVTERLVELVHAAGAQVHVWTVNDADRMRALLDLGVDGLITDRADALRQVLVDRGEWAT